MTDDLTGGDPRSNAQAARSFGSSIVALAIGVLAGHFDPSSTGVTIAGAALIALLGLAWYALVPRVMLNAAREPEERETA